MTINMKLNELAKKYGTDKCEESHGYIKHYEKLLKSKRDKIEKVLELGIGREHQGASLKMWRDYLPNADIVGLDINDFNLKLNRIYVHKGDQSCKKHLKEIIDEHGTGFDMIIDDGGHWCYQQLISLGYLFRHLKSGGFYAIEDIMVPYVEQYNLMFNRGMTCDMLNHPRTVRLMPTIPYEILQMISYGGLTRTGDGDVNIKIGKYGILPDESNSVYEVLKKRNYVNPYIEDEDIIYLQDNVKECNIYTENDIPIEDVPTSGRKGSVLAILVKK